MAKQFEPELVRVLRKPAVAKRCGLGQSTIDQMVKRGDFPPPIKLTRYARGWLLRDVDRWLEARELVST